MECQVDEQIIEELLKAGAKPSTNDPMQNSAIALASKKCLSYFPLLVEHTDKDRLDDYDLDGKYQANIYHYKKVIIIKLHFKGV